MEACTVAHYQRFYPTYYIKGEGEVDLGYISRGRFWPIEVKWTGQVRSKDLKQVMKYSNSKICSKDFGINRIHGLPNEFLSLNLLRLGPSPHLLKY